MLPTRVVRGRKNPAHETIPERLRKVRKAAGMPAAVLSRAAGVGENVAASVESGKWVPLLDTIERLADALKLSPSYLAFGVDAAWVPREGDALRCAGLAARAREAREVSGLSLRKVGRRLDTAASTVQSIEGGTMPRLDTTEKLAKALSVSPSWLAYGIGPMEPVRRRKGATMSPPAEKGRGPHA